MFKIEAHTEAVAAFGPGQIVIRLRSRVTEQVLTGSADTGGNADNIFSRDAADGNLTIHLARCEAKCRIAELRDVGIDVNTVAPIGSGQSNARIVDEGRRKYVL